MKRGLRVVALLCGVGLAIGAAAQDAASAAGKGTVTGHVIAGDTQRPARFATVVLFGVPANVSLEGKMDPNADEATQMKVMKERMASIGKTNMMQVQTGLDGSFEATDVIPGDYYVFATAAGYLSPLNEVTAMLNNGADPKKPLAGIPQVHVSADREGSIDVTMDRGAAISGTISWDDGSPVSGAIFTATPAKGEQKTPLQFSMLAIANMMTGLSAISDDQGHYRITGLMPGDYIVQATLQTAKQTGLGASMNLSKMMHSAPLVVYAPAGFHKTDAKAVTLTAGEDLRDQAVTLDLSHVRSVSGRVESAEDHHGVNSATVTLTDKSDKDLTRSAGVDAAGNFEVTFVPPGTYTLTVNDAEDTVPDDSKKKKTGLFNFDSDKTVRSYLKGSQDVIVGDSDVTGVTVALAVDKSTKAKPDVGAAVGALLGGDDSK